MGKVQGDTAKMESPKLLEVGHAGGGWACREGPSPPVGPHPLPLGAHRPDLAQLGRSDLQRVTDLPPIFSALPPSSPSPAAASAGPLPQPRGGSQLLECGGGEVRTGAGDWGVMGWIGVVGMAHRPLGLVGSDRSTLWGELGRPTITFIHWLNKH